MSIKNEDLTIFTKNLVQKLRSQMSSQNINIVDKSEAAKCSLCKGELEERVYTIVKIEFEPPKTKCRTCNSEIQLTYNQTRKSYTFKHTCNCKQEFTYEFLEAVKFYKKETKLLICKDCSEKIGLEEVFGIEKL